MGRMCAAWGLGWHGWAQIENAQPSSWAGPFGLNREQIEKKDFIFAINRDLKVSGETKNTIKNMAVALKWHLKFWGIVQNAIYFSLFQNFSP